MPDHRITLRQNATTWLAGALASTVLLGSRIPAFCADVVIEPTQTCQTIEGWGHGGGILGGTSGARSFLPAAVADPVNYQYLNYLADDLGLTGSRTWEVGPRIDGSPMDDGDCDFVNWNLFEGDTLLPTDANYLVYFQNRVLGKGIQPSFYSSPGYPSHASDLKPWVLNHPGERAQQIWASAYYLKTNYGLNISYGVIYNEPSLSSTILTDDIKALGPRLAAHGLPTRVQYAEAVAPLTDWGYVSPVINDPDLWQSVGRISYHNYGTADPYRAYLRDTAAAKGITTAQTEMADPSFDDLFNDLTLGGVTYWEVAYAAPNTLVNNPGLTSFTPANRYFRLRQLIHYVHPGAVRIGAISSDPAIRVLSFLQGSAITTVIENTSSSPQNVNLSGLPPGTYGLSSSVGSPFQESGLRMVGAGGSITITNVAGNATATTLYPWSGTNNPPSIQIWGSNPGYVVAPTNTATLSVTANDPELDPLTYLWSLVSQPAGSSASLVSSNSTNTVVNGLTRSGCYVFNVDVRDAINKSSRQVYLMVYDSNPPPVLGQTGFRINAPYGLVFGDPSGTTHANIELPLSTVTLQAGIADLANSNFSGRGQWTLVSQPSGANAVVGSTTYIYVSIRADVTGMTTAGDYTFQLVVSDPGRPSLTAQIVCTVHPASSAPAITSVSVSPASLTLPVSSSQLSAVTSSTNVPVLRHWWVVKSAPAGARPVFDHQGATNTTVSNLVLPGSYTFTLRAFDDLHMTTFDKMITVSPAPGAPVVSSPSTVSIIAGNPLSYSITASGSPTHFNAAGMPADFQVDTNTGVITGTPSTIGTFNIQLSAANTTGVGNASLALTVKMPVPLISSSAIADGLLNTPFSYSILATGVPTTFTASGLPPGLALDSVSGLITGTPTNSGTYAVTITASNATGPSTSTLTIVIYSGAAAAPSINTPLTAVATVGSNFYYPLAAANNPTSFFVIGLPAGLTFDPASGRISGIPSVAGNFRVTLRANNHWGTGTATLQLTVNSNTDTVGDGIPDWWRAQYFGGTGQTTNALSCAACDADGTRQNNLLKYLAGLNPTNAASVFRITAITPESTNLVLVWQAGAGKTNVVQAAGSVAGVYSNLSSNIFVPGSGDVTNSFLDSGGAKNFSTRFYRVRIGP